MKRFSKTVAAFIAALLCTTFAITTSAQSKINQDSIAKKMGWFEDAKLGIFIHYGIYAVNDVSESWSFHNKQVTWPAYMSQLSGFTASKYDPTAWA
ncbi:MAG: alpha-L-fucosidase, partial [Sediminibacterium sp.]